MNCTHVQRNLKAFFDGELRHTARLSVAVHLVRCRACGAEMEAIKVMSDRISRLDAPAQSDATREFVLAAARDGRSSPVRTAGRRVRTVLFAAGGAGVVIAAALFLMLRPTTAQAALQRVIAASEAVKTCHMEWLIGQPDGPQERRVLWYEEGKFRMEDWHNGKLEDAQVFHDGQLDTYVARTNQVLRAVADQPFGTPFEGFTVATMIKHGVGDARVECESVRGPEGQELNRFTITEELGREVVLADPATDLPVSVELYGPLGDGWEKIGESEVIEYNVALDPSLFVLNPPPGAVEVDQEAIAKEWQQRFDAGMARAQDGDKEAVLRDFQVTIDGDVFAVWTGPFLGNAFEATLTDSAGTVYLPEREYGQSYFSAAGNPSEWFIALVPPTSQPAWYSLRVGTGPHTFTFRVEKPVLSGAEPAYPLVLPDRGQREFSVPGVFAPLARAESRAQYWKNHGDLQQARRYYDDLISAAAEAGMGLQANSWLDAATVYEQLGLRAKAHGAYQRGLEFHRRDPNRNNPDQIEVAEKLEQGLKRTR